MRPAATRVVVREPCILCTIGACEGRFFDREMRPLAWFNG